MPLAICTHTCLGLACRVRLVDACALKDAAVARNVQCGEVAGEAAIRAEEEEEEERERERE